MGKPREWWAIERLVMGKMTRFGRNQSIFPLIPYIFGTIAAETGLRQAPPRTIQFPIFKRLCGLLRRWRISTEANIAQRYQGDSDVVGAYQRADRLERRRLLLVDREDQLAQSNFC